MAQNVLPGVGAEEHAPSAAGDAGVKNYRRTSAISDLFCNFASWKQRACGPLGGTVPSEREEIRLPIK